MKSNNYFKKRMTWVNNMIQSEIKNLQLDPSGEVFDNYISLKPILENDYWNNIQVPLWFISELISQYLAVADSWYEIAKSNNLKCNISLIIHDPDYVFTQLNVNKFQQDGNNLSEQLPDKFDINDKYNIVWEKVKKYDEKSWKLEELTPNQIKGLIENGYEIIREKDKLYNGKIYDVGDIILRKEIGLKWIGNIKNNC